MTDLPFELPRPAQTSKFAMYSLVFALLNILCIVPVLSAVTAIVCGFLARRAIRLSEGRLSGTSMANWGIMLGIGGIFYSFVFVYGFVVPMVLFSEEWTKVDGIMAEFRETYARSDAEILHAKLSAPAREKIKPDELKKILNDALKDYGTFDTYALDKTSWFTRQSDHAVKSERLVWFPYEVDGPRGKFRVALYCRKLEDDTWKLDRFEFSR